MTRDKSGLGQLGFLVIVFGMAGAAASAQTQLQPPPAPTAETPIHDVKIRSRNDPTDHTFTPTPDLNKFVPTSEPKRIRTTRERITDGSAPPAVAPLQPPPAKP